MKKLTFVLSASVLLTTSCSKEQNEVGNQNPLSVSNKTNARLLYPGYVYYSSCEEFNGKPCCWGNGHTCYRAVQVSIPSDSIIFEELFYSIRNSDNETVNRLIRDNQSMLSNYIENDDLELVIEGLNYLRLSFNNDLNYNYLTFCNTSSDTITYVYPIEL
ncbi:MAG: hypothetical protein HJHJAOHD_00449 [Flavobacteriales bacterium]|nr:hypothetical protein [Flavobacteriales bacterium]